MVNGYTVNILRNIMLVLMFRQFGGMSAVVELHSSYGLPSSRLCRTRFIQFEGSGVTESAYTKIYIQNSQSDFAISIARKQTCMQKWKLILSINLENRSFAVVVGSIKGRVAVKSCYLKVLGTKKLSFTLCNLNLPSFSNVHLPVIWLASVVLYQVT